MANDSVPAQTSTIAKPARLSRRCACGRSVPSAAVECDECARAKRTQAQFKLEVDAPDSASEREADSIAARVLNTNPSEFTGAPVQVGRAGVSSDDAAPLAPHSVEQVISSSGFGLDAETRAFFEPRFGHDFGDVRVHAGAAAAASAQSVNALAYTVGKHIAFASGRYSPRTQQGRQLLAHELTHVLQQGHGKVRLQRQLAGCQDLLQQPAAVSVLAGRVVHQIIAAHFRATVAGATSVAIPGASAGPLRSTDICGGDSKIIDPQIIGGMSGAGFPDLARRTATGVLQVAEIKPAVIVCLIDGEEQVLRYINQGNARDSAQVAWRSSLGVSVVTPMPADVYQPPPLMIVTPSGTAELRVAWCSPGLLAYTLALRGLPVPFDVRVPQTRRAAERERLRNDATARGLAVGGAAVATAVAGRALWRHFWKVVITRFALREGIALGLAAADGPLPIGDLIGLGMTLWTIGEIISQWDDIWREADSLA